MAEGDRAVYHPSPAELDHFLLGEMSPREAALVLAHLIRGCEQCQRRMAPLASVMLGTGRNIPEPPADAGSEYDFPLFKAFAAARHYAETRAYVKAGEGRAAAPAIKKAHAVELAKDPRMEQNWARCETLLERCRSLRHNDPEAIVLMATLAVSLAERLDSGSFGTGALADLQARAWAELGNARRIADDLAGAESEFARALDRAGEGTGDPLLLARLMDLAASLYTDQRRFNEALQLLDAVYVIYYKAGDWHSAGRALISKGVSTGYAFNVEDAVHLISQGLGLIDAGRDPKLAMVGIHNLIWCLVESGQVVQADQLFAHSRTLFSSYIERLDAIKATWLEGRIAAALGDDTRAEQRFMEARTSFEEAELPYDVALVALDMAALWLRAGRTVDTRRVIDETISIFRARKIRREAIGMMLMLREALQKDQATEALLRTVAAELLQLQDIPGRRKLRLRLALRLAAAPGSLSSPGRLASLSSRKIRGCGWRNRWRRAGQGGSDGVLDHFLEFLGIQGRARWRRGLSTETELLETPQELLHHDRVRRWPVLRIQGLEKDAGLHVQGTQNRQDVTKLQLHPAGEHLAHVPRPRSEPLVQILPRQPRRLHNGLQELGSPPHLIINRHALQPTTTLNSAKEVSPFTRGL